ncbi:hypothetical protein JW960_19425 [candidate division KSB1 bacterium]|nr:hypothetical protein [candidate division KSB1 bacterium]
MPSKSFIDLRNVNKLISLKKYDEAERILLELKEQHPDDHFIDGALINAYLKSGVYDKAKRIIDGMLREKPDDYFFLSRKGDLLAATRKVKAALELFNQLYNTNEDPHIGWRLANLYFKQKKYDKAEYFFDQTIPKLYDKAELFFLGFQIKRALNKNDDAANLLERAIHLSPDPAYYKSQQMNFKAEMKGISASEWEKSLIYSESKFDPNVIKQLAEKFLKEKKYDKAELHFKEVLKRESNNLFYKSRLAYVYYKWQKYDLALSLFLELPMKNFLVPSFMTMVINAARKTGQEKMVISYLRVLLEKNPDAAQLYGAIRTLEKRI